MGEGERINFIFVVQGWNREELEVRAQVKMYHLNDLSLLREIEKNSETWREWLLACIKREGRWGKNRKKGDQKAQVHFRIAGEQLVGTSKLVAALYPAPCNNTGMAPCSLARYE